MIRRKLRQGWLPLLALAAVAAAAGVAAASSDDAAAASPEQVMESFIAAMNRHSVDDQYAHYAEGMVYIDEGQRFRAYKEMERSDREFEAVNDAVWSYEVLEAGPDSLEMIITEDMEFYRLLGVGPRSHRARYRFRDGKIVEARVWSWTEAGRPYGKTRDRFVAWLLAERPEEAERVTRGGGLLFTQEAAPHINELLRQWPEAVLPSGDAP